MKLVIQIPCCNEEATLALVFENLPRQLPGISTIEYQLIDDCCTDRTVEIAQELGFHHIVKMQGRNRRWLGRAFRAGVDNALANGADILVNTDGDNQYPSERIADLVAPIVAGQADLVIGDRSPSKFLEFSRTKRFLQWLGNKTISLLTGEEIKDAVSGFRAYSTRALLEINLISNYTYTIDSLIQALRAGLEVAWLPITPNKRTRESRLIKSNFEKVWRSGLTIVRMAIIYRPFKTFLLLGSVFLLPGALMAIRYVYWIAYFNESSLEHIQLLISASIFLMLAVILFAVGLLGDLLSVNRVLASATLSRIRRIQFSSERSSSKK